MAFKLAMWCSTADPDSSEDRQRFFQFIRNDIRRPFAKVMPRGKSTIEVLRVAHRLNIPYLPLPGGAFQIGMGSALAAGSSGVLQIAIGAPGYALDKQDAYSTTS